MLEPPPRCSEHQKEDTKPPSQRRRSPTIVQVGVLGRCRAEYALGTAERHGSERTYCPTATARRDSTTTSPKKGERASREPAQAELGDRIQRVLRGTAKRRRRAREDHRAASLLDHRGHDRLGGHERAHDFERRSASGCRARGSRTRRLAESRNRSVARHCAESSTITCAAAAAARFVSTALHRTLQSGFDGLQTRCNWQIRADARFYGVFFGINRPDT
jgi:hypothetical protein